MMTDDPIRDFTNWDAENAKWLESRPMCACCGDKIQDDSAYKFDIQIGHRIKEIWICNRCIISGREDIE